MVQLNVKVYINPKIDRTDWGPGPWDDEPDKVSWTDPETGMPCLMVRNHFGAWCGYVAVNPGHPYHGVPYGNIENDIEVHGGLTFSDSCNEDGAVEGSICHVPEPGQPADVHWFGFDCNHYMDIAPDLVTRCSEMHQLAVVDRAVYRTLDYVREQCESLARQLVAVR